MCKIGNAFQTGAQKSASAGQAIEAGGAVVAGVGFAAAGQEGAVPGAFAMATGGVLTWAASAAQFLGGALQYGQDPSIGDRNMAAGAVSFAIGAASFAAPGFFARPGSSAVARAFNENLDVQFATAGAGIDFLSQFLPDMEPHQATCP